jgi:hypothetical protein
MIPRCLLFTFVFVACFSPVQSFVLQRCVRNGMSTARSARLHAIRRHKPDLTSATGVEVTHDALFTKHVLSTRKPSTFVRFVLQWRRRLSVDEMCVIASTGVRVPRRA